MYKNRVIYFMFLSFLLLLFGFIIYSQIGISTPGSFEEVEIETSIVSITPTPSLTPLPTMTKIITPAPSLTPVPQVNIQEIRDGLITLEIPRIGVNSRVDVASTTDSDAGSVFSEPQDNPLWIPLWSVEFGLPGVSLVYGHRQWGPTPKVFTDLDKLEVGDGAYIYSSSYRFSYVVDEVIIINPEDIWEVANDRDVEAKTNTRNDLMLLTCTPWGTSLQRIVVFLSLEAVDVLP